jgi:large subunit ribosomal protein L20
MIYNLYLISSNLEIDRKILSNLAINEPYSFKSIIDEVKI